MCNNTRDKARERRREMRKNEKILREDGGDRRHGFSATLCVRMQIPVRFAAGRHLFVTHSRSYTAADSMEHTRVVVSTSCLTSNSSFSSATSVPLAIRYPSFPSPPQISKRPRRPCTLPQLSATVISLGYFCPRIAPPPLLLSLVLFY